MTETVSDEGARVTMGYCDEPPNSCVLPVPMLLPQPPVLAHPRERSSAPGRMVVTSCRLRCLALIVICAACSGKSNQNQKAVRVSHDAQEPRTPHASALMGVEIRPHSGASGEGIVVRVPRAAVARVPYLRIRSRCLVDGRVIVDTEAVSGMGTVAGHRPRGSVLPVPVNSWTSPPSRCEVELFSARDEHAPFRRVGRLCYAAGQSTHGRCSPALPPASPNRLGQGGHEVEDVWFHTEVIDGARSLHMNFLTTFARVAHPEWLRIRAACRFGGEVLVTEEPYSIDWETRHPIGIAAGDTARLSWWREWPLLGGLMPEACELSVIRLRNDVRRVVATFCYKSGSRLPVACAARSPRRRHTKKYASTSRFQLVPSGLVFALKVLRPVPRGAELALVEQCTSFDPKEPPIREHLQGLPVSPLRPGESSWYLFEDRTFPSREGRCDLRIELELPDRSRKVVGRSCYSAKTRSFRDGPCR